MGKRSSMEMRRSNKDGARGDSRAVWFGTANAKITEDVKVRKGNMEVERWH